MPRNADPAILHAEFRPAVLTLLAHCEDNGLPIRLYEGGRSPVRQVELYARGRVPGAQDFNRTVTRARAWGSHHQYALAGDLVFYVDGRWTWEEPREGDWTLFTQLAAGVGLRTLSFERPHVELPVSLADLYDGRYPANGGDAWMNWVETRIESWGRGTRQIGGITHPGAPPLPSISERPVLVFEEGLPASPFT